MDHVRLGGRVAFAGAILGLLYAPFHAAAYLATEDGDGESEFAYQWSGAFRDALPWAFDFAQPQQVYEAYGILSPIVLGALAYGLFALHLAQRAPLRPWAVWTLRVFLAGHVLFALGAFVAFYTPFLTFGFFGLIIPGMLLTILGYVVYGVATVRAHVAPRLGAWLMVVGGVAQIPLSATLGHNPLGFAVVYAAWLVLGAFLMRGSAAIAPGARPPTTVSGTLRQAPH